MQRRALLRAPAKGAPMLRPLLILALVVLPTAGSAQTIYRSVDRAGYTVFSDQLPPAGTPYTVQRGALSSSVPQSDVPATPPLPTVQQPLPLALPSSPLPGEGPSTVPTSAVRVERDAARDRRAFVPSNELQTERRSMRLDVPQGEAGRDLRDVQLNAAEDEAARNARDMQRFISAEEVARQRRDVQTNVPSGEAARNRRDMYLNLPEDERARDRNAANRNE